MVFVVEIVLHCQVVGWVVLMLFLLFFFFTLCYTIRWLAGLPPMSSSPPLSSLTAATSKMFSTRWTIGFLTFYFFDFLTELLFSESGGWWRRHSRSPDMTLRWHIFLPAGIILNDISLYILYSYQQVAIITGIDETVKSISELFRLDTSAICRKNP